MRAWASIEFELILICMQVVLNFHSTTIVKHRFTLIVYELTVYHAIGAFAETSILSHCPIFACPNSEKISLLLPAHIKQHQTLTINYFVGKSWDLCLLKNVLLVYGRVCVCCCNSLLLLLPFQCLAPQAIIYLALSCRTHLYIRVLDDCAMYFCDFNSRLFLLT